MGILKLKKGAHALYHKQPVVVANRPTPLQVMIRFEDGRVEPVDPQELHPEETVAPRGHDTHGAGEAQLAESQRRYDIIRPLLTLAPGERTRKVVEARAEESRTLEGPGHKLCAETLYDWIRQYQASGELLSMLRSPRSDRGKHHLPEAVAQIIEEQLGLAVPKLNGAGNRRDRRLLFRELMIDIEVACRSKEVRTPHPNTVRNALNRLPALQRARASGSRRERARHEVLPMQYAEVLSYSQTMQIDHTMLDIVVVDDEGNPIGRPWLTLGILLKSRMVMGMELSLYPPGEHTTLACTAQAILPKNAWLKQYDLDPAEYSWPCFGKVHKVHSDNGKDFWANGVMHALTRYGIDHHFRMVGKAHWGSHIERLMGTVSVELKALPGYTGPNTVERKDLDLYAERDAVMTMKRLREWLMNWILNTYHKRWHEGLKGIPQDVYLRDQVNLGGVPELITGEQAEKLRIDFLPSFMAAITSRGVQFKYIRYYDAVLDNLAGVKEHALSKRTKESRFHYSPHDLRVIYLYDEGMGGYQRVRMADLRRPAVTLWEVRAALKELNDERAGKVDEEALFRAVMKGRAIQAAARSETKAARMAFSRLKESEARAQHAPDMGDLASPPRAASPDGQPAEGVPGTPTTARTAAPKRVPDFPVRIRGIRA